MRTKLPLLFIVSCLLGPLALRAAASPDPTCSERVEFSSEGSPIVGTLHRPPDLSPERRYPGVVVLGSWFTVKEQMPELYAVRLAQLGFVALTFDPRYFGESGGEPRFYEMPADKAVDIGHAVDFLATLPYVDPARISGLGICLGAGIMVIAAQDHPGINAIALVAPGLQNAAVFERNMGADVYQAKLAAGDAALARYAATGQVDYIPVVSSTDPSAAVVVPDDTDYYLDPSRGAIPEWTNLFALPSWAAVGRFDSIAIGAEVRVPILMIHSETGANPDAAKQFFANLPADTPKEQYWLPGTQYDFYDREPQLSKSVSAVSTFLATLP
ncbi:MAG: dienelactone hydrolase family protein [Polyangiales bacterium]